MRSRQAIGVDADTTIRIPASILIRLCTARPTLVTRVGRLVKDGPHCWDEKVAEVPTNDSTIGQRNEEKARSRTSHAPKVDVLFLEQDSFRSGAFWASAPFLDGFFSKIPSKLLTHTVPSRAPTEGTLARKGDEPSRTQPSLKMMTTTTPSNSRFLPQPLRSVWYCRRTIVVPSSLAMVAVGLRFPVSPAWNARRPLVHSSVGMGPFFQVKLAGEFALKSWTFSRYEKEATGRDFGRGGRKGRRARSDEPDVRIVTFRVTTSPHSTYNPTILSPFLLSLLINYMQCTIYWTGKHETQGWRDPRWFRKASRLAKAYVAFRLYLIEHKVRVAKKYPVVPNTNGLLKKKAVRVRYGVHCTCELRSEVDVTLQSSGWIELV
ncbi:hypothetical protein IW262DRAFT_1302239 [Armillaria fumosa]|nr:hypothetical protein IW262DRAFT_1302239 [Armillaria fumosa]